MWISLFTVVLAIALGCGFGAVLLEGTEEKSDRNYARRPTRH